MIQVMSRSAVAVCRNCRTVIFRGKGDFDRDEHWWHDQNGKVTCPGAPTADPDPKSISPVRPLPHPSTDPDG